MLLGISKINMGSYRKTKFFVNVNSGDNFFGLKISKGPNRSNSASNESSFTRIRCQLWPVGVADKKKRNEH